MTSFNLHTELNDLSVRCSRYIDFDYSQLLKKLQTDYSIKNNQNQLIDTNYFLTYFQSEFNSFVVQCYNTIHQLSTYNLTSTIDKYSAANDFSIDEHHIEINNISSIDNFQFSENNSISSVEIGSSVISIGKNAFSNCKALQEVKIHDSTLFIGEEAFAGCEMLSSITLPKNILEIPKKCFKECEMLLSIDIPDSVVTIEDSAFFGCSQLKEVNFSKNLILIEPAAFKFCKSICELNFPVDQHFAAIGQSFKNCVSLTSINIPHTVFFIDPHAFCGCPLKSVSCQNSSDIENYQATFKKYLYYKNIDNTLYD